MVFIVSLHVKHVCLKNSYLEVANEVWVFGSQDVCGSYEKGTQKIAGSPSSLSRAHSLCCCGAVETTVGLD